MEYTPTGIVAIHGKVRGTKIRNNYIYIYIYTERERERLTCSREQISYKSVSHSLREGDRPLVQDEDAISGQGEGPLFCTRRMASSFVQDEDIPPVHDTYRTLYIMSRSSGREIQIYSCI